MSLNTKQVEFSKILGEFLVWCFENGYEVIAAELFRTEEQARWYAARGKGIINSAHRYKLAIDLFRYVNGKVSWNHEDYEALGEKWKSMHPLARWGGDFRNRDSVHFSMEHNGRY